MTVRNMVDMAMLFVVIPMWVGILWVRFLKIQGIRQRIVHAWVFGLLTMFAVAQVVLVPMIARLKFLTDAISAFGCCMSVLAVLAGCALVSLIKSTPESPYRARVRLRRTADWDVEHCDTLAIKRHAPKPWTVVFAAVAIALIFAQAFIITHYQHLDDDDSRFVSEEVSAYEHNSMLMDDPITVDTVYWGFGEVQKDRSSPWTMYVAMCAKIIDVHPAIISHTLLPCFLIVICYVVYEMIGEMLFRRDMEKVWIFLIFMSALNIFAYMSTHTLGSMLLLRIWQGKAMVASFAIPLLFYLMCRIFPQKEPTRWMLMIYILAFATSLMSAVGLVVMPIMLAIYGLVDLIYSHNFYKTIVVWLGAVPCIVYLLYYFSI